MNRPSIMLLEPDGRYREKIKSLALEAGWEFREPRKVGDLAKSLACAKPAILVIRTGKDLAQEMTWLDITTRGFPSAKTIVINDFTQEALSNLAWQLGATLVLPSNQSMEQILFSLQSMMNCLKQNGPPLP
ncbi:MAG: hypothetical protein EXR99_00795 [Gemmataceae bacterium]|nr:hypothetical protein [Gemmataceae bacterium]